MNGNFRQALPDGFFFNANKRKSLYGVHETSATIKDRTTTELPS
ncbi:hypothetical protein ACQKCJ_07200 [Flavobacterium sp. NPDC079362]|nr:hypothetical protein [Flavobacterium azizsancarii]